MEYKRINSLDAVGGLFIIFMISRHAFQMSNTTDDQVYIASQYFLFMFMAWFFYKSGRFHRDKDLRQVIKGGIKKFIYPFMLYTIVGAIIYFWGLYDEGKLSIKTMLYEPFHQIFFEGSYIGNLPLWFLLSLFFVKVIVAFSRKLRLKKEYLLAMALIVAGGGTLLIKHFSKIPFILLNVPLGLIFYLTGFFLKKYEDRKIVVFVSLLTYTIIQLTIPSAVDFRCDNTYEGYWTTYIIASVAGIIVIDNLFKFKFLQLPVLTSIGRNSMEYYCLHWILFEVIQFRCFRSIQEPNYDDLWTLIFYSVLILPCVSYWIKLCKQRI